MATKENYKFCYGDQHKAISKPHQPSRYHMENFMPVQLRHLDKNHEMIPNLQTIH